MLELTKHKQYLISKQKHSKISLYLIMLPRQLLHTHSTNYTHTCTNWLKGCDNYKLKLIIVFLHECRDCIAQSRNTTNFLLITSESTITKNYEYICTWYCTILCNITVTHILQGLRNRVGDPLPIFGILLNPIPARGEGGQILPTLYY